MRPRGGSQSTVAPEVGRHPTHEVGSAGRSQHRSRQRQVLARTGDPGAVVRDLLQVAGTAG